MKKDVKKILPDLFGRFILAVLLFYSLSRMLWEALALDSLKTAGMIQLAAGAVLCLLLSAVTGKRARMVTYIALLAVLAMAAIAASRYISDGWNVVFNRIFSGFELRYGRIFPYFKSMLTRGDPDLCAAAFLLYPTALLAVCSARAAGLKTAWRFAFPAFAALLWAGAILFRLQVSVMPLALFILALAGMRARSIMLGTTAPGGGKAILPVLLSLTLLFGFLALPLASLPGNREMGAIKLREGIAERIHDARYHTADSPMHEGDFTKLGNFEPGDGAALYVEADDPAPMYLRGYVGDVYTGYGWKGFRPEILGKYATSFSWTHSAGFYGQTQYAALIAALGAEADGVKVRVENISACSAYEFIPCTLDLSSGGKLDKNAIGDFYVRSKGLYGERVYEHEVSSYPIDDYNVLYNLLVDADRQGDPGAYEYLRYEGAYREFVYKEYLALPGNVRTAVRKLPDFMKIPQGAQVSFEEARRIVLNSLLENYAYNETPGKTPKGWDFALWFLDGSKSGYAPHFATAATLMFRELGIPARYVEGYAIRGEEVRAARNGRMEVPQANAHAWVEIYRDGVGFIPFEVTPPFVTEQPETAGGESGGGGSGDIEPDSEEQQKSKAPLASGQILRMLLALLLLVLIAALATLVIRRHVIKRRREKLLGDPDNREAVCWLTAYGVMLLERMGVTRNNSSLLDLLPEMERLSGPEFAASYAAVVSMQRVAMFSGKPVPDDYRIAVLAFTDEVLQHLKRTCGLKKRLYLKWILCLY